MMKNAALFAFPTNSFIACPYVSLELKTIPKYLQGVPKKVPWFHKPSNNDLLFYGLGNFKF